jgi:hypothetical protein
MPLPNGLFCDHGVSAALRLLAVAGIAGGG